MQDSSDDIHLLKSPEDIYSTHDNNQKLSYFYNSNRIISSHIPTHQFFKYFNHYTTQIQQKILNQLLVALRTVSTNAYILNQQIKGRRRFIIDRLEGNSALQIDSDVEKHLLASIIDLIMTHVHNYVIFNLLLQVLEQLMPYSPLEDMMLFETFSKLTVKFHDSEVHADQLFAAANVLKAYFNAKIITERDPINMLVFHGSNKIEIMPKNHKPLTWILKQGFTLFFWINLENIKSSVEASLPKLFTFYAPDAGGVEAYLIDNKVYYRIIGVKYTEPQIGSNGIFLGEIQGKKWTFLGFEHEGHHTFQKSKLKFYVNKNKPQIFSLDPPKISSSTKTIYIFFDKLFSRTSSVCLFPSLIGQQGIDEYNKNINSIQSVKSAKALVFENRQGKVIERSGFGVTHNYVFERNVQINIELELPLFYLLRYQEKDQSYPTLNQLLNIFILFLRQSATTQIQAYKNHYFKIISQLISEVPRNIFDQNTIKSILHIKHTITDLNLLDQFYSDFLWPLLYANIPLARKEQILEILKNAFTQNIAHYSPLIGLDEMINLLQKLEGGSINCCEKHFKIASNKFQRPFFEGQVIFGEQKKAQGYIISLIESTLQNSKLHFPQEIYKICRLLCLKCSPCFILQLMSLIRKLLTQKFTERMSEHQTKQIIKYFQQKKVHFLFIHLIENQFFAQIKAESVKLIYSLLIKRSSIEEEHISNLISKSLWKINQFAQEQPSPKSSKKSESRQQEFFFQKSEKQLKPPIIEEIEEEDEKPFALVGPQAPALSNRLKGKKTFDFGFVAEKKSSRSHEIMEQQKTTQPLEPISQPISSTEPILSNPPPKKKDKKAFLSINTQAINEMYTFGGEKGQQLIISQDQEQKQLQKIKSLAKKCISAMKGQELQEKQVNQPKRPTYVAPPMTSTNKVAMKKKNFNLRLISEEQDEAPPVKIPTPLATKKSNKTPTSIKSSNEQNLYTLYNSLLESCLGVSFQTCLISNSKVQVPSILGIFFKWIPQTDLETKFLNDLDIILESSQNMALIIELPQLYDFLFELCYKCLLFEELKQKRIYVEKLENIIKVIFSYIYREDLGGFSKFSFILNWIDEKKNQDYEPKCLFLTSRYVLLLILQCIEELLIMNNSNNPIMEKNFQSLATVLDTLKKIVPEDYEQLNIDNYERVVFTSDFELPNSLIPYFKSEWADFILYQKYLFIFKRFYCTDWYNRGLKNFVNKQLNFIDFLKESNIALLQKESGYYLKNNFLVSLIEIHRAMLLEIQHTQPKDAQEFGNEAVWQTILLVAMVETNKQKTIKSQRSEIILAFLKSCKLLAEKGIERIVQIISILSNIATYLSNPSQGLTKSGIGSSTIILDELISDYIPEYLLNINKADLESFILNFNEVWIPNQTHYKKIHSDLFVSYREKAKKQKQYNFVEYVSTLLEQENERKQFTDIIIEAHCRNIKNNFRKLWKNLRIYHPLWSHPSFKWQQDTLFNKSIYSYERYQNSPFFKFKVAKQMSKGKGRFFLKPKLIEPNIVSKQIDKEHSFQIQYNLEKAVSSINEKLMIGTSKKGWIVSKTDDSLNFAMGFKKVKIINTLTVRNGYLAIISENLVFISSKNTEKTSYLAIDQYQIRHDKTLHKCWPLEYIKQIHRRRYVNKKKSILIYFIHGKSLTLDFNSEEEAQEFCKRISKLKNKCVNLSFVGKSSDHKRNLQNLDHLKKWINYQLSTFDYLMELNICSGRAFSDLTQYPVFPWTLINFGENKPQPNDEKFIRNLALPMGANGTEDRIHNFEQRYEMMHVDDEFASKFHYGTHYSSPGIIYHFLVRLSPYTQGSVLLQSGKFDFADRLFFSFADSYKNAVSEYSDVRELIPELYTIPEAYLNINGLDFGLMQNKKRVNNLELPDWARENPYLFVYNMRKCLEEESSSRSVHHWVDLIFGFKQRGEQAMKSLNSFYYLTYEDAVPWQKIHDDKDIQSIESQIVNFGQTPSQIFSKPHHERNILSGIKNYRMICDPEAEPRVYRPTKNNKQVSEAEIQLNPFRQPDESIIFMKWVSESKVVFIRKSGDVIFYKCSPNTNTVSKVPFQCTVQKQKKVERIRKHVFDPNQYYDFSLEIQTFPLQLIGGGHTICLGGLADGKLVLIDVDTGSLTNGYHGHSHTISYIKSDSTRQNFLITGDIKGNVIMWQIKTSHNISKLVEKRSFKDQIDQITSIVFSSELQCFAVASMDGSVFLYNMITGKKLRAFYHPKRAPINQIVLTCNPLAAIVMFCNTDNTIYSYSINGQLIARIHEKSFSNFLSPIVVKDSKLFEHVIFGNERSQVHVKSLPFLETPVKNMYKVARDVCVNKICVSKHNRFLVTGCSDGELTIITDPQIISNP